MGQSPPRHLLLYRDSHRFRIAKHLRVREPQDAIALLSKPAVPRDIALGPGEDATDALRDALSEAMKALDDQLRQFKDRDGDGK